MTESGIKFGSWTPFPVVSTLDYALFSLAEAKAKESIPSLKQVMQTHWIMIVLKIKNSSHFSWLQILRYREHDITRLSQKQPCSIYTSLSASIATPANESLI